MIPEQATWVRFPRFLGDAAMQLPVLRFDPLAVAPTPASADTAGTQQDLKPVGGPTGHVKALTFDLADVTSVGDVATAPGSG